MTAALILLGAGGHARVLAEILRGQGQPLLGAVDPQRPAAGADLAYLGDDAAVFALSAAEVLLVNGVGSVGPTAARRSVYDRFVAAGYRFAGVRDATAIVSPSAQLGAGVQVLAAVVVATGARLGDNVLINTGAVVEHDCAVGAHCHIATGAILCGGCTVESGVHIGAGATVNQGLHIGAGAVVAAGAVVIADVPPHTLVAGVPARVKRRYVGGPAATVSAHSSPS